MSIMIENAKDAIYTAEDYAGNNFDEEISPGEFYTLENEIGNGKTAIVYEAVHPVHGRVAVKQFRPQYVYNGEHEAELLGLVQGNPSFPTFFDSWEDGSDVPEGERCFYIAMELLDGELLYLIDSMSDDEMITCVNHLMNGLEHLHLNCGLVHFDLKPENIGYKINLDRSIEFKILDLGTAEKLANVGKPIFQKSVNKGDVVLTTSHYRSYEAIALDGTMHDEKADMWSLGCIMYEMYSKGDLLFDVRDTLSQAENMAILEKGLQTASLLSSSQVSLKSHIIMSALQKCIVKDKEHRFSVKQLREFMASFN